MKKIGICIAALLTFAAVPALAQEVKLTLGHGAAAGNPRDEGAKRFAEAVKEKSNGRIGVQVAGSAQLGDDAAMVTGMRTGSIDMSLNSQGAVTNVVPEFGALGCPTSSTAPGTPGRSSTARWAMRSRKSPRPRA